MQRVRWLHRCFRLNGHRFRQTLRDNEGQRRLVCCSPGSTGALLSNWTTTTVLDHSRLIRGASPKMASDERLDGQP